MCWKVEAVQVLVTVDAARTFVAVSPGVSARISCVAASIELVAPATARPRRECGNDSGAEDEASAALLDELKVVPECAPVDGTVGGTSSELECRFTGQRSVAC